MSSFNFASALSTRPEIDQGADLADLEDHAVGILGKPHVVDRVGFLVVMLIAIGMPRRFQHIIRLRARRQCFVKRDHIGIVAARPIEHREVILCDARVIGVLRMQIMEDGQRSGNAGCAQAGPLCRAGA